MGGSVLQSQSGKGASRTGGREDGPAAPGERIPIEHSFISFYPYVCFGLYVASVYSLLFFILCFPSASNVVLSSAVFRAHRYQGLVLSATNMPNRLDPGIPDTLNQKAREAKKYGYSIPRERH